MKKFQKVQASAGSDSRLGRRWETVVANLLISNGINSKARQVLADFGHEADLVISGESGDCVISVAHVKQRNPKEKYYRLLDELALFKQAYPKTRKILLYAGDFLAEQGWKDVLGSLFDAVIHIDSLATRLQIDSLLTSEQFTSGVLTKREASQLVRDMGVLQVSKALKEAVVAPLRNEKLWVASSGLASIYKKRVKSEREARIKTAQQTELRRPLLAAICIPPDIRLQLRNGDVSGFKMSEDAALNQESLGTLTLQSSVLGFKVTADEKVTSLIKQSYAQIGDYEAEIRKKNSIYSSYLDDLHQPNRIKEMVDSFSASMKSGKIEEGLFLKLLRQHGVGKTSLLHTRATVWPMELALAHAKISRNELDKRLATNFSNIFPNARNVTGRYIYGELADSKKMTLNAYEAAAAKLLSGTVLLNEKEAFLRIVEDRRYAIAVIQNPKPMETLIKGILLQKFPKVSISLDPNFPTLISKIFEDATGKKAGRLGVVPFQYGFKYKNREIVVRALSGFDRANINHKLKELAAKMAYIRLFELSQKKDLAIFIAVLDGDWNKSDHESLVLAGYDYVSSTTELSFVLEEIKRSL